MMWKHLGRAFAIGAIAVSMSANAALADQAADKVGAPKMDPAAEAAMMAEMIKMGAPGPEHKMLEAQVGTWRTVSKSWMGPGEPDVSDGTAEYELILGGRFLLSRFHGKMMGQPFEGFSVMGYDRGTKSYEGYWTDTMSTAIYPMSKGTWDDAARTLTFNVQWPNPMGAGTLPYKLVTKLSGADAMLFTLTMSHEGKEMPMTEVSYTRMK